jgi:hypothetical protein
VPVERTLEVVKENAQLHRDNAKCDEEGLMGWFCCLHGACQFKPGTEVWASEKKGMMPGPNFGEFMSKDKFERWMRCTSEGPKGATDKDPLETIRWLVKGYNDNRKKTIKPSWLVVVDETMWAWTGQGMPRLSSVPRKPEPLGAEIKNLCDGESGFMLHIEIQEGKLRMARKKCCDLYQYKATAATTVRLAHKGGLDESNLREEDKVMRVLVGGSWFASHETAAALLKELQVLFVGNVKAATAKYPLQQLRWDLAETALGDHAVYKL